MKPVIESIAASTELARWIKLTSGDKELIKIADVVMEKNHAAVNWVTENRRGATK